MIHVQNVCDQPQSYLNTNVMCKAIIQAPPLTWLGVRTVSSVLYHPINRLPSQPSQINIPTNIYSDIMKTRVISSPASICMSGVIVWAIFVIFLLILTSTHRVTWYMGAQSCQAPDSGLLTNSILPMRHERHDTWGSELSSSRLRSPHKLHTSNKAWKTWHMGAKICQALVSTQTSDSQSQRDIRHIKETWRDLSLTWCSYCKQNISLWVSEYSRYSIWIHDSWLRSCSVKWHNHHPHSSFG